MRLLTVAEAAHLLMCSENSVRRWSNLGLIPCYRMGKRRDRKFKEEELKQTMESWRNTPRKEPTNGA